MKQFGFIDPTYYVASNVFNHKSDFFIHLTLTFPDDFQYQVLRVVGALVGFYWKSCFVNLK